MSYFDRKRASDQNSPFSRLHNRGGITSIQVHIKKELSPVLTVNNFDTKSQQDNCFAPQPRMIASRDFSQQVLFS
jgi:hypothetical protein